MCYVALMDIRDDESKLLFRSITTLSYGGQNNSESPTKSQYFQLYLGASITLVYTRCFVVGRLSGTISS